MNRKDSIVAVCDEMRTDSYTGNGLHPTNYERDDLFDCVENCVGFKLTHDEHALAVVAFEEGPETAKVCIWYRWVA